MFSSLKPKDKHTTRDYATDVAGLLSRDSSEDEASEVEDGRSEWEKCCDEPQISVKRNLLEWWSKNEKSFPTVGKMAKQVLACPACST